ncbi:MAG: hypothetical protein HQL32_16010 [Planctomycetes bacterium]|nr:hypothetical protein [Planctomycetota bacterium]
MNDLKLPIPPSQSKDMQGLELDLGPKEYLEFVLSNLKYCPSISEKTADPTRLPTKVPFVL